MILHLSPQLGAALAEQARRRGVAPEALALEVLRERFLPRAAAVEPQDEWERKLFEAAIDCGVSVPDSALSSDGLYDRWPSFRTLASWGAWQTAEAPSTSYNDHREATSPGSKG